MPQCFKKLATLMGLAVLLSACRSADVYTISGRVSGSWQCLNVGSSRVPTMIALQPLDWIAPFSLEEPQFAFSNVPVGDYRLEVICNALGGPFSAMPVTVSTADLDVEVVLPFPHLPTRSPMATLIGHEGHVQGLAFSADGSTLVSVGAVGGLSRFDANDGQRLQTLFHGHADPSLPLVLSADGALLASGTENGDIRLLDGRNGEIRHTLSGLDSRPLGIAFSPGAELVTAWQEGEKRRVAAWDVKDGALLYTFDLSPDLLLSRRIDMTALYTQEGSELILVVSLDREWRVEWRDGATGELFNIASPPGVERVRLSTTLSAAISPDGKRFAFGTAGIENSGNLIFWEPETDSATTGRFPLSIDRVAFSPNGTQVATTAHDNTVVLWGVSSGDAESVLVGDNRGIDALAWSPDGTLVAAANDQGQLLLWQVP